MHPGTVHWANTDGADVLARKLYEEVRYLAACAIRDGRSTRGVLTGQDLGVVVEMPAAIPPRTEYECLLTFEPIDSGFSHRLP